MNLISHVLDNIALVVIVGGLPLAIIYAVVSSLFGGRAGRHQRRGD